MCCAVSLHVYTSSVAKLLISTRFRFCNYFCPLSCIGEPYYEKCVFFLQDDFELRKDTTRRDDIISLKRAWEEAEPGRAEKVKTLIKLAINI